MVCIGATAVAPSATVPPVVRDVEDAVKSGAKLSVTAAEAVDAHAAMTVPARIFLNIIIPLN
jgi:hypothetical protein